MKAWRRKGRCRKDKCEKNGGREGEEGMAEEGTGVKERRARRL